MASGRIPSVEGGIQPTIVDAKGDLIVATAADTVNRLAVGTNEQRLVAASGETTGLKYVADTTNYAIAAKGDLLVGTAADTVTALSVGTNNYVLTADSAEASGVKWAAAAGGGKVLQVVNQLYQTNTSSSSSTLADTGITLNITPTSVSSKVLVLVNVAGVQKSAGNAGNAVDFAVFRGATKIGGGDAVGYTNSLLTLIVGSWCCTILDSPATTSATTYKVQFANDGGNNANVQINFSATADYSTITLMEIGA